MRAHITRNSITAAVVLGLLGNACVPMIANFSKGQSVPTAVAAYAPMDSHLLVLPMWLDTRMYHFHSLYVIPASAIGTPQAAVPRRMGLYLDSFVCGGPTTFVVGYLVVLDTGTVIWSDVRGDRSSSDKQTLKPELKALVTSGQLGPALRELIQYNSEVAFDVPAEDRSVAMLLLDRIPDE